MPYHTKWQHQWNKLARSASPIITDVIIRIQHLLLTSWMLAALSSGSQGVQWNTISWGYNGCKKKQTNKNGLHDQYVWETMG